MDLISGGGRSTSGSFRGAAGKAFTGGNSSYIFPYLVLDKALRNQSHNAC